MLLFLDDRKQPIQAFMEKPDGCTILALANNDDTVFQPEVGERPRTFVIRTTANLRYAVHNADHTFVWYAAPPLWTGEEKMFRLDGSRRDRVSMRAELDTATATITEVDD